MPWLEVDRESSFSTTAALVNVPCGVVVDLEHGYESIGEPVGATDVAL